MLLDDVWQCAELHPQDEIGVNIVWWSKDTAFGNYIRFFPYDLLNDFDHPLFNSSTGQFGVWFRDHP
jgi:hypothetical protein